MKIGIVFAGQGAQYSGMGKDLYDSYPQAKEIFDLAGDSLPNFANELATGEKTAAQVVAEVKQPLQAYLDDNYNK